MKAIKFACLAAAIAVIQPAFAQNPPQTQRANTRAPQGGMATNPPSNPFKDPLQQQVPPAVSTANPNRLTNVPLSGPN